MVTRDAKSRNQSGRRRQKGASIIEGSFVLLITLSLIFFILDMGRFLLTQQYISERARTTARLAVLNNWDAVSIQNYLCYGSTMAPAGNPVPSGLMGLTPTNVSSAWLGTSTSPDYRLKITVTGIRVLTWIPLMSNNLYTIPVIATAVAP